MIYFKPLQIRFVRVQIFEAKSVTALLSSSVVDRYNAAPPVYLAFPDSSPHIVHSYLPSDNVYMKTVFQALSIVLGQNSKPLHIKRSSEIPVKSLTALTILKGTNRGAKAQGAWGIYARGEADTQNSPLEPLSESKKRCAEDQLKKDLQRPKSDMSTESLEKLTNLRFYGSVEMPQDMDTNVQFSSAEFAIKSIYEGKTNFTPTITLRLQGSDVFQGVKDLALNRIVDITTLPGWLTGEYGTSSGTIINGHFSQA